MGLIVTIAKMWLLYGVVLLSPPDLITAKPAIAPAPGTYKCPLTVTISHPTRGVKIFYTVDGSTPTTASRSYSGPLSVSATETVQAIAVAGNLKPSPAVSVAYSCAFTRADFAKLIQKQYNLPAPTKLVKFPDVGPGHPAYSAIEAAAAYMNEQVLCPMCHLKPEFFPDEPIYRKTATLALVRILVANRKIQLLNEADTSAVLAGVPDAATLPAVARPYFATAIKQGVLPLRDKNTIQPALLQTRQDMAAILNGVQKKFNFPTRGVIIPR